MIDFIVLEDAEAPVNGEDDMKLKVAVVNDQVFFSMGPMKSGRDHLYMEHSNICVDLQDLLKALEVCRDADKRRNDR
jgi:hypothetical protein